MPRKKRNKNQLPSGNTRLKVYDHSELVYDSEGKPVIDEKTGKQKKRKVYVSITASSPDEARMAKSEFKLDRKSGRKTADMTVTQAIDKYVRGKGLIVFLNISRTLLQRSKETSS